MEVSNAGDEEELMLINVFSDLSVSRFLIRAGGGFHDDLEMDEADGGSL